MNIGDFLRPINFIYRQPGSERASIVLEFLQELNRERVGTKWKPLTGRWVAIMLSPIKTNQELYEFLSECKDYKNRNGSFGKRFYGKLKK